MKTLSTGRTLDFPPQLSRSQIEAFGVPESLTWGPQALWLLCGLIWNFWLLVRDIPELARNTALVGAGATLTAALAVAYQMRRRRRRTILYPTGERIGLYRGELFQYSFTQAEMLRVRLDFFGWIMVVAKLLLPMVMLMAIVGVVMWDGLKQPGPPAAWKDISLFVYLMLFALFGFTALYRSHIWLAHFWIPDANGRPNKELYLHPRELRKLEQRDVRAIG